MQRSQIISIVLIAIIVVASFIFLDLGVSKNRTKLESYPLELLLGTPQVKPNLLIYVEDGAISNELKEWLIRDLSYIFEDVKLTGGSQENYNMQILYVEYSKTDLMYTPVYSKSHIELNMTFSSNGDIS
jgi:hypothetical protein